MDPLHKIIEVLSEAVPFRPTQHAPSRTFQFGLKDRIMKQVVEVRCIRIDGKNGAEEPTWPDVGDLFLNGRKIFEFKPIQNNSALKKRKDEKIIAKDVNYYAHNTIQIRESVPTNEQKTTCRISLGSVYFIGVYLVQPLLPINLIDEIKLSPVSWMSLDDCREAISLYMKKISVTDVQVE
jgi:E3 SUMO-protein ligase PIAS1